MEIMSGKQRTACCLKICLNNDKRYQIQCGSVPVAGRTVSKCNFVVKIGYVCRCGQPCWEIHWHWLRQGHTLRNFWDGTGGKIPPVPYYFYRFSRLYFWPIGSLRSSRRGVPTHLGFRRPTEGGRRLPPPAREALRQAPGRSFLERRRRLQGRRPRRAFFLRSSVFRRGRQGPQRAFSVQFSRCCSSFAFLPVSRGAVSLPLKVTKDRTDWDARENTVRRKRLGRPGLPGLEGLLRPRRLPLSGTRLEGFPGLPGLPWLEGPFAPATCAAVRFSSGETSQPRSLQGHTSRNSEKEIHADW